MEATARNEETVREIINLFADKKYTVGEAEKVLNYVRSILPNLATVRNVTCEPSISIIDAGNITASQV